MSATTLYQSRNYNSFAKDSEVTIDVNFGKIWGQR